MGVYIYQSGTEKSLQNAYIGEYVPPIDTPGIYHNATLGLISLSSDGESWTTIADKNLGATSTDITSSNSYGNYYQRGNNYGGYKYNDTITYVTSAVNVDNYGPGNYYNNSTFVYVGSGYQIYNPTNTNLRGGVTGTNEAKRGPCPEGYHIPTGDEFVALYNLGVTISARGSSGGQSLKQLLLIPEGNWWNGGNSWINLGRVALWGSNVAPNGIQYYALYVEGNTIYSNWQFDPYQACPIRPFKNEAVQPDSSRTKLY